MRRLRRRSGVVDDFARHLEQIVELIYVRSNRKIQERIDFDAALMLRYKKVWHAGGILVDSTYLQTIGDAIPTSTPLPRAYLSTRL